MLNTDVFIETIKHAPLAAIDLVICSSNNGLLMGKRLNEPASGYWFVPGGRIYKLETLETAFGRISQAELGFRVKLEQSRLLGAYTHIYPNNFAHAPGIGTHYVVLAYQLIRDIELHQLPLKQHSDYRWFTQQCDLSEVHPNSLVYLNALSSATTGHDHVKSPANN